MKNMLKNCLIAVFMLLVVVSIASGEFLVTAESITLTGPTTIVCPPENHATYTVSFSGTGAVEGSDYWLRLSVYDDDPYDPDDMLQNETVIHFSTEANGDWSYTKTFELWCEDHEIRGSYGSSWETTAEVYAMLEYYYGSDIGYSNIIEVTCVPEPASTLALGFGVLIILIWRRHFA
jgi:hypothetical protein